MQRSRVVALAFLVIALASVAAVAEPNFSEGMWEVKAEMKLEGMPFPMPAMPIGYAQCITKKDLVPQKQEENQECTKVSEKIEGNTVTWVMTCKDAGGTTTESTGTATYAGATFDSVIRTVMTDKKGERTESTLTMKGRRTGDCK